jgi:hypothetical protein
VGHRLKGLRAERVDVEDAPIDVDAFVASGATSNLVITAPATSMSAGTTDTLYRVQGMRATR